MAKTPRNFETSEESPFARVTWVSRKTGLSVREVWRKSSSDPSFPKSRKLSVRKTVWVKAEVEAWIKAFLQGAAA